MSNRELLQSIHRANVNALSWQHVSLRAVQNRLQLHGLLSSLFLFQPWRLPVRSNLWTLRDLEEFDVQIQVSRTTVFSLSNPSDLNLFSILSISNSTKWRLVS